MIVKSLKVVYDVKDKLDEHPEIVYATATIEGALALFATMFHDDIGNGLTFFQTMLAIHKGLAMIALYIGGMILGIGLALVLWDKLRSWGRDKLRSWGRDTYIGGCGK